MSKLQHAKYNTCAIFKTNTSTESNPWPIVDSEAKQSQAPSVSAFAAHVSAL